jgi:hypothetical protein
MSPKITKSFRNRKCGSGAAENLNDIDHMPNLFRPYVRAARKDYKFLSLL